MFRNLFAGLGIVFAVILVFTASFLGGLAWEMHSKGPAYEKLAVDITRELSRDWQAQDIKNHYAFAVAHRMSSPSNQRSLDRLKPLGALRYADDVTRRTRWTRDSLFDLKSSADAAEMLAEMLSKTVRITFVAKYEHGFADVTVELKNEGGEMKLWHIQIESQEPLPGPASKRPQAISRA